MPVQTLPKLPLVCLETADFMDTSQVVEGKNTIIGKLINRHRTLENSVDGLIYRADTSRLTFLALDL